MTNLDDKLERLFAMQLNLQIESYGADPGSLEGEELSHYVHYNTTAATDEAHEALKEVHWKPWVTLRGFKDRDAFVGELIDELHFLVNRFLAAGATADEVITRYERKREVNAQRQRDGYDGVSTKCPGCGRAMDDEAVLCRWVGGSIDDAGRSIRIARCDRAKREVIVPA